MAKSQEKVELLGVVGSPFVCRVQIALKLKGIEYKFQEQDLQNKSEQLLKYNPVYKKVPVFVHNDKPISESLVILEYIDETWKNKSLLPSDPYQKALAHFCSKLVDDKIWLQMMVTFSLLWIYQTHLRLQRFLLPVRTHTLG